MPIVGSPPIQPWRCHQPIALRAMDSSRFDGVGVHLVRPPCLQFGRHHRQNRVVDRGDGEDGRLASGQAGPVGTGSPASIHPHVVSEIRSMRAEDLAMSAPVR
ncbi:hypothetical protein ACIA8I_38765 [Streptomyces rishiriensis]|uniref:hypothetical protein n=1 Tax=Streptomyces rishiriensis TaxID=68264 RepID=UPI00379077EC